MSRTIHVCLDVRDALRWPKAKLRGMICDADRRRLTVDEVRDYLLDELAQGHEVLPFGEPCDGFDYKTGCPGHEIDEPHSVSAPRGSSPPTGADTGEDR